MEASFPPPTEPVRDAFALSLAVRIRACKESDLSLLEWEGAFSEHREIIQHAYRLQTVGENLMLMAEANRYPIGQVWIDFRRRRQAGAGYLWAVRVWPAFRNAGVGKRLVCAAEAAVKQRNFPFAELAVETWNVGALQFYERLGFDRVEKFREPFNYITPDLAVKSRVLEEWRLRKRLD